MKTCDDTDMDEHWLRQWLVAWWCQAITSTNVDLSSKVFCGIHLRTPTTVALSMLKYIIILRSPVSQMGFVISCTKQLFKAASKCHDSVQLVLRLNTYILVSSWPSFCLPILVPLSVPWMLTIWLHASSIFHNRELWSSYVSVTEWNCYYNCCLTVPRKSLLTESNQSCFLSSSTMLCMAIVVFGVKLGH